MRAPAIAFCLLAALAGCQPAVHGPTVTDPAASPGPLNLYQARLRLSLAMPRQVQALPDFWDHADITVHCDRLKAPATSSFAIATSSFAPPFYLPPGPATISIQLHSQGVQVANGWATASLTPGLNPVNVTMAPILDQVLTLAGTGLADQTDGVGANARFNDPRGMAMDAFGNLYVADTSNHKIRKITPGGAVSTVAGSGTPAFADGTGAAASFNGPSGVAVDPNGNLYVADTFNHRIRMITPAGDVSTLAGSGATGSANTTGTTATFWEPWGITLDTSGNLYVADFQNNVIRKIATPSMSVTTFSVGTLNGPSGLAINASNELYVASYFESLIKRISVGGTVMSFAGTGTAGYAGDGGPANVAQFNQPRAVAVDASGSVYVADTFNFRIRRISPDGNNVVTVAGEGVNGMVEGPPATARFAAAFGIAVRGNGARVYLADTFNQRIRVLVKP